METGILKYKISIDDVIININLLHCAKIDISLDDYSIIIKNIGIYFTPSESTRGISVEIPENWDPERGATPTIEFSSIEQKRAFKDFIIEWVIRQEWLMIYLKQR